VILQVVPSLVTGGVERGAVDIAAAVVEAGGTAIVASEGGPMERELKRAGALHLTLPLASKNPFVMYRNIDRLTRIIKSYKVDLVHARSRAPAWSARSAARRCGCHLVTTFHAPYNQRSYLKRRYNAIMLSGERVIAISDFIAEHIRDTYKVDPAKIQVIHRGVDLRSFDPEKVSAERMIKLATDWRVPDGIPFIILPGRLTRWKGHGLLLKALTYLKDLEFRCALVGSDQGRSAYRNELESLIQRYDLADRTFILDHCNDMPAAYMLADVVVSASSDPEGFGRVVSEAQALGRPVAASDHGGAREQVIADRTAFLFPSGDAEALADALRRALSLTSQEREMLSFEAVQHVRRHYSRELMCSRTIDLYRDVLEGGTPPEAGEAAA
jgi:glycosyltransferase involved in cell wall biosynthesis